MKFEIKKWATGKIICTAEIDASDNNSTSLKLGLAVKWAVGQKIDLQGADLRGALLQDADLRGADLRGALLQDALLQGALLQGAFLRGADLRGALLQGADLRGAFLRGADLRGADLRGALLQDALLQDALLQGALLQDADLQGADLRGALLQGALLQDADLRGAFLRGADGKNKILLVGERPILQIGMIGSRSDYLIAYNTDNGILIQAGCWIGTVDDFETRIKKVHGETKYALEYGAAITFIKSTIEIWEEGA